MAQPNHTRRPARTEEALTVLFCLVNDAYAVLNPRVRRYESLTRIADSEVTPWRSYSSFLDAKSERSFLRDAKRFFSPLFPGEQGLAPFLIPSAGEEAAEALPGASQRVSAMTASDQPGPPSPFVGFQEDARPA